MESTFITIHDLSAEARILYASHSIIDILGHTPEEVIHRACWDFFHPHQVAGAQDLHERGMRLDKAAVIVYCSLLHRDGHWVVCECCFTFVYNVMVACTSIYRPGVNSQKRAAEAPIVRRLFTSSPQDPRYHMLSHLSTKFRRDASQEAHEPRAALFINRFTRTLTLMYSTSGIEQVVGISAEDMKGRSFYDCIAVNCLNEAVYCLERARSNDSIAYLRFWWRDPRQDDRQVSDPSDNDTDDAEMTDVADSDATETDDEGGVTLEAVPPPPVHTGSGSSSITPTDRTQSRSADADEAGGIIPRPGNPNPLLQPPQQTGDSRTSSHQSLNPADTSRAIFDTNGTDNSSDPTSPSSSRDQDEPLEVEAVISCTSDGLVVILRRARPLIPGSVPAQMPTGASQPQQPYAYPNGIYAAPWAPQPHFLPAQPQPVAPGWYHGMHPNYVQPLPPNSGPSPQDFMNSIRDCAVFAWALVGINGNLANEARGRPGRESQPPELPVWGPA